MAVAFHLVPSTFSPLLPGGYFNVSASFDHQTSLAIVSIPPDHGSPITKWPRTSISYLGSDDYGLTRSITSSKMDQSTGTTSNVNVRQAGVVLRLPSSFLRSITSPTSNEECLLDFTHLDDGIVSQLISNCCLCSAITSSTNTYLPAASAFSSKS